MFYNSALHEMTAEHIMRDRLREAEQYRLLKRAEAARRSASRRGFLALIRQALAVRRRFIRPTAAAG